MNLDVSELTLLLAPRAGDVEKAACPFLRVLIETGTLSSRHTTPIPSQVTPDLGKQTKIACGVPGGNKP